MRIICVDDEKLILNLTVSLCEELPDNPEVESFNNATDALEWLKTNNADIALLDINLPDMDGITLAARMKEIRRNISIIFLTGYSEYAVDAFKLHASGYLLKPINKDRLAKEIEHAMKAYHSQDEKKDVFVRTFGNFDVFVNGKIVKFERSKAKELLAYLVDRNGNSIKRVEAFSTLWEDKLYDRSMQKQLDVIARSLRSTLKEYNIEDILEVERGTLRVVPEKIDCDLYKFYMGDVETINSFHGEYMSEYSWASITGATITR